MNIRRTGWRANNDRDTFPDKETGDLNFWDNWMNRVSDLVRAPVLRLLVAPRGIKRALALVNDTVACIFAAWLSFMLRLGAVVDFDEPVIVFTATALLVTLAVFLTTDIYRNVFRFHGPRGLAQIARASFVVMVPLVVLFGFLTYPGVPRTISVIYPILMFLLIAISRVLARFVLVELVASDENHQRVLIYGAGEAGRRLAGALQHEPVYRLIAYADDDGAFAGQRIEGTRVLSVRDADAMLAADEIDLVLLAVEGMSRSERAAIIDRLRSYGVHVQVLPGLNEIVAGDVSISDLREIDIADLLGREKVAPDPQLLSLAIAGKSVLVTGAGGSIGSELSRQIVRLKPQRLVLFEMTEAALFAVGNEIRAIVQSLSLGCEVVEELGTVDNAKALDRLFDRYQPDTVYHAAAYKHVPLVEANVVAGVRNNVFGTLNCALAAHKFAVERFILVSTDKAVRPTNVMGATKRVCEMVLQALSNSDGTKTIFSMVRFGNVLGSSGSVVPLFRGQISAGGPVTLTHRDITRYFMTIPEAAELVIQAGSMARGGEVFLLDMGESVRIYDLARSMITMSGRTVRDADNPDGDIEILEVGLRPGEKLFEELLIDAEASETDHARIFRASEMHPDWSELELHLARMRQAVGLADREGLKILLRDLVTGYVAEPARDAG